MRAVPILVGHVGRAMAFFIAGLQDRPSREALIDEEFQAKQRLSARLARPTGRRKLARYRSVLGPLRGSKVYDQAALVRKGAGGDALNPLRSVNRPSEFDRSKVADPSVAPTHGWRHRFKTVGIEAGMGERVVDAIQGHAPRTAGDGHGEVTVKAMAAAMAKMPRIEVG